jgi:hypothetical protein
MTASKLPSPRRRPVEQHLPLVTGKVVHDLALTMEDRKLRPPQAATIAPAGEDQSPLDAEGFERVEPAPWHVMSHERQRLTGDAIGGGKGLAVPFKREFLIDDALDEIIQIGGRHNAADGDGG